MTVKWEKIRDKTGYAKRIVKKEVGGALASESNFGRNWNEDVVSIERLKVDKGLLTYQDKSKFHSKRRDQFIRMIVRNMAIKPLIVFGRQLFLIDGYARYRALEKLGVKKAKILRRE